MARWALNSFSALLASVALIACVGEPIPTGEESDDEESETLAFDVVSDEEPATSQQRIAPAGGAGLELPTFDLTDEPLDPKGAPDPGKSKASDPQPNPWEPPTHHTDT